MKADTFIHLETFLNCPHINTEKQESKVTSQVSFSCVSGHISGRPVGRLGCLKPGQMPIGVLDGASQPRLSNRVEVCVGDRSCLDMSNASSHMDIDTALEGSLLVSEP